MNLRHTFDSSAAIYHRARPRYPAALFDRWEALAALDPSSDKVLEIGPATGVATEELARRGHRVDGVELGPALATAATEILRPFPKVTIMCADFEAWEPEAWGDYGAVVAATMWHWLDPAVKYRLAHRHLRPGGSLAFWSALHVVPEGGDTFFAELQSVYDEIGLGSPGGHVFPEPGQLPVHEDEILSSGLFEPVDIRHFDWEVVYEANGYIELLSTFSVKLNMAPWQRDRLFGEIRRRLDKRADGLVRRHWGAVLHVAKPCLEIACGVRLQLGVERVCPKC